MKKSQLHRLSRLSVLFLLIATTAICAAKKGYLSQYKGAPYQDSHYQAGAQKIPGKVLCAYYDLGGEGVAYHDSDAVNHGSGALNPANGSVQVHPPGRIAENLVGNALELPSRPRRHAGPRAR
jgi:hypothetical protein